SAGNPPSLPPFSLIARLNASRMSAPIAALGPDSVLTNPIFTLSAAWAATQPSSIPASASLRMSLLPEFFSALHTRNPHLLVDDAAALDDQLSVELDAAVAPVD